MSENTCLEKQPLCDEMLQKMDTYWRAANYLSAGQLYLLDNPLLRKPLTMDHVKKKIVVTGEQYRDRTLSGLTVTVLSNGMIWI